MVALLHLRGGHAVDGIPAACRRIGPGRGSIGWCRDPVGRRLIVVPMERILAEIRGFDGVLELAPQSGSEYPPISWGDHFFYFAPDGQVPSNRQPYATIMTKDYPGDDASRLDPDGRWRLNIHVGTLAFRELLGGSPSEIGDAVTDFGAVDVVIPHPLYGGLGWVSIVNVGPATTDAAVRLLRTAHEDDRRRVERRDQRHP